MSVGRTIAGRYEVYRKLGRGGMGVVYAANDLQLQRRVALKAIRREFRLQPAPRARFLREARALSKLEHPSICRIHDYVSGEERDYLVLELIEGASLRERLTGSVERAEAFRLAEQIGDALSVAHAEGLVHRDLKPGNVMVTADGTAKILDFGLARMSSAGAGDDGAAGHAGLDPETDTTISMTVAPLPQDGDADTTTGAGDETAARTVTSLDTQDTPTSADSITVVGSAVGTPRYMSPEQARGEEVGAASDMFSFGLLLHELFTGERAYAAGMNDGLPEDAACGRTQKVRGLDRPLTDLIERLKSPAPSRRPTAVDAIARLRWIRDKPKRRLRWALAAAAAVVVVAASLKYTFDLQRERAAAEFRRSQSDQHIEFMVEELYEKLEPVGRVDILEEVGLKALEYFETLDEDGKTDEDRARTGRTWTRLGHVRLAGGDFAGADEAFDQALAIHAALVEGDGSRGEWLIGLSGAHFGVGSVAFYEDDLDTATTHFEAYMDVSRRLLSLDPGNPEYRLEMAYALTNMAGLHSATGEPERAIAELEETAEIKQALLDADPNNRDYVVSLANTEAWLADIVKERGDHERALGHAEAGLDLRRKLAEDERDTGAQQQLSISLQQVGGLLALAERRAEAEAAYREDVAISLQLSRLDPDNVDWRRGLAISWDSLGEFYMNQGRLEDARPLLESAAAEYRELIRHNPDVDSWHDEYEGVKRSLAELDRTPRD